ncbi:hypothetical protein [Chromohalobacter sp. 296-RDG]|uniref:hypothetical protein n=1 Tax=Chromohalobacter sp. 296-RDG TaxID=2994062 RepID=UPI0024689471|nr:hypothetical protein [Chromohalobacter sp. 296-RDG]
MKLLSKVAMFCFLAAVVGTAEAREFAGNGQPACVSEELLDQLLSAVTDDDDKGVEYLLNNGCLVPRSGIEVSVLDRSWTGTTKVRAYVGDQAMVLWTVNEALTE